MYEVGKTRFTAIFASLSQRYQIQLCVLPTVLLLAYFVVAAAGAPFSDYAGYYFGSKELLSGHFHRVYDTWSLNQWIAEQGYTGQFVSYSPFPPFTSLVMAPFLWLPPATSKLVFTLFSALLFTCTLYRCIRFFSTPGWLALLLPVIFFIPLRNNIFFGQGYLLLTVLLLEGYLAYKKGKLLWSSIWWAIAILFKIFPVLIVVFLLVRKQYKQVLYLGMAGLVLFGLSLLVNGIASWQFYVFDMMPRINQGELNSPYTFLFQSAFMLLKNIFIYDEVLNPGVVHRPWLFVIVLALFKAFVVGSCIQVTLRRKADDLFAFGIWMAASLLISPNGSSYSLILLLIPCLTLPGLLAAASPTRRGILYACVILLLGINTIPVSSFANWSLWLQYPRLYLMVIFFVVMLIGAHVRPNYLLLLALFLVFTGLDARWLQKDDDRSVYLFQEETRGLLYDFAIRDNRLYYYYWDQSGSHEMPTGYTVQRVNEGDVRIAGNQLYYRGRQVSTSADWKKKAVVVDDRYIIYLSDKHRGAGFYTLRRLALP